MDLFQLLQSHSAIFVFLLFATVTNTTRLIFEDNFNDFDLNIWKHELTMGGGGNWEFQMYVNDRENSFVKDGILHLKPSLTSDTVGEDVVRGTASPPDANRFTLWGGCPADLCTSNQWWGCERYATPSNILNPIRSARVRTAESFSFKYGRVEVRAKLPKGDWLWPAIWMLPQSQSYGPWPMSGEMDIMESRGNKPGYKIDEQPAGFTSYGSTLHWGPSASNNGYPLTHGITSKDDLADAFHTYGLYWDDEELYMYLDEPDNVVMRVEDYGVNKEGFWDRGLDGGIWTNSSNNPWKNASPMAPFDEEMYLIMNLAVGGTVYFPDDIGGKPWTNTETTAALDFYNDIDSWLPTWRGDNNNTNESHNDKISDDAALQIDSVKVFAIPGKTTYTKASRCVKKNVDSGTSMDVTEANLAVVVAVVTICILMIAAVAMLLLSLKHKSNSDSGAAEKSLSKFIELTDESHESTDERDENFANTI